MFVEWTKTRERLDFSHYLHYIYLYLSISDVCNPIVGRLGMYAGHEHIFAEGLPILPERRSHCPNTEGRLSHGCPRRLP
jgi:hypothetical protein